MLESKPMTRTSFYLLMGLVALWGTIKYLESKLDDSCQAELTEQTFLESKLASAQKLNVFNAQLLKRLVIDSHTDPALLDLLARHNVTIVASPDETEVSTPPAPAAAPATPVAPAKP
jgi:hypothetical protein